MIPDGGYWVARCEGCQQTDFPFETEAEREEWITHHAVSSAEVDPVRGPHKIIRGRGPNVNEFTPDQWIPVAFPRPKAIPGVPIDRTVNVRFDATGMGWWWGIFVGPVLVWSWSATEGPMSPEAREILSPLVAWGTTFMQYESEAEFAKAVHSLRNDDEFDPEVYYAAIGRPRVP